MPTRLPSRRSIWRKLAPTPETARNLLATTTEFVAALLFAAALWRLVNRPTPKPAAATKKTRPKSAPRRTQPKKADADDHAPPPIARLSPPTDQETRR